MTYEDRYVIMLLTTIRRILYQYEKKKNMKKKKKKINDQTIKMMYEDLHNTILSKQQ